MRIMGKKTIIIAFFLTIATIAFGQISRNGQLQQFIAHDSYFGLIDCKGIVYDGGIYLPIVKAKTKSVKIITNSIEYSHFEEKWGSAESNIPEYYQVMYDTMGMVEKISYFGWSYILEYENDRLMRIVLVDDDHLDSANFIKIKYDATGIVSKILINDENGPDEIRVKWNTQGFLSQIQTFYKGNPYRPLFRFASTISYQVTQSGRSIVEIEDVYKRQIVKDEHGAAKRNKSKGYDYFYENEYDAYGNLIQQVRYEIRNGEKYYTNGCRFNYEYEFYE